MEISITNFKSIGKAQVKLGRATVLLGPPAAGKSNLLETIAFATYFDRYAFYDDVEPLPRLVRTDNIRCVFTQCNTSKLVEIGIGADGRRRTLRLRLFQNWPRLELNHAEVPIKEGGNASYLFSYSGRLYQAHISGVKDMIRGLEEKVLARLYGFDRFKDSIVNSMVNGVEVEAPSLLREDGKNFGAVAAGHVEVFKNVNAELKELSQTEIVLLDDGRVAAHHGHIAMRPPESLLRVLYYLVGLSSTYDYARLHGLEDKAVVLLEDPEVYPKFFHLLVEYIAKFSEVGYVVITTHNPILVSLLRDRLDVTPYYVYRGDGGLTEVAELDKDKLAEELATSEDVLFMKPSEVLHFVKR